MGKKRKKFRKATANHHHTAEPVSVPTVKTPATFTILKDPFCWIVLILISLVGIGFYFTAFSNQFIWDDTMVITPNEYIRDWRHIKEIFTTDIHRFGLDKSNFYRPFQGLSYMIDYTFWQLKPKGYHIASVFYHILNAFLIYLILPSVLQFLDPKVRDRCRQIAVGVALIWVVHPIHTQAVTYAAGRADVLVGMFILLTIYAFMRGQRVLSWACFVGALLSKEFGMITPAFVFLFEYFGLTVNQEKRWKKILPFLLILAVYVVLRLTVFNFPQEETTAYIPGIYGRVLTSVQAIMILLGLLVAPLDLSMDRNIDWTKTIFDVKVIASGVAVVTLFAAAWLLRRKQKVLSFGLMFFIVGYALFLNIIKMNANVSEHWMYLPSIGIWVFLLYALAGKVFWMKNQIWFPLIAVFVIYQGFFLVRRNADFKNEITFYNQILERSYNNARVHYNLGCAYFFEDDMEKSRFHLSEAIKFKPDYAAAYGNLGQLEYRAGHTDKAIALYEQANRIKPDLIENRANLGTAYSDAGRFKEAIEQLQFALQLNPKHVGALNNLGICFGRQGKFDQADAYFQQALQISPDDQSAQNNLAFLNQLRQKSGSR